ncbi:MAG: hypothetical protein EBW43_03775 [Proteobacteria bacterium]|nr:hypothetical protein [Pseudomonadota bacterium]
MSQELVTYIVLGSKSRLQGIKLPANSKFEEYISLNFDSKHKILEKLDQLITASQGELIVLLPRKNLVQNIKKVNTLIRSIPDLEQGIYFTKRLYFSVGGFGSIEPNIFSEISKRLYSRIDPQKPMPALIIRTKNLQLD